MRETGHLTELRFSAEIVAPRRTLLRDDTQKSDKKTELAAES
jgi:hypothetical protein